MDELYYAFVALMEATQRRDKAEDEYTGYSWGYYGQRYESEVDKAKERWQTGFTEAVREIVKEVM